MVRPGFKLGEELRTGRCKIRHFKSGRPVQPEELNRLEQERPDLHLKLSIMLAALGDKELLQYLDYRLLEQFERSEMQDKFEVECGQYRWLS